jgi:hypothetical protein
MCYCLHTNYLIDITFTPQKGNAIMPRFIVTTRIIETTTVEADTAEEAIDIATNCDAESLVVMGREAERADAIVG